MNQTIAQIWSRTKLRSHVGIQPSESCHKLENHFDGMEKSKERIGDRLTVNSVLNNTRTHQRLMASRSKET